MSSLVFAGFFLFFFGLDFLFLGFRARGLRLLDTADSFVALGSGVAFSVCFFAIAGFLIVLDFDLAFLAAAGFLFALGFSLAFLAGADSLAAARFGVDGGRVGSPC